MHIDTRRLTILRCTPAEARAQVEAMVPEQRREVSADWLARLYSESPDPWMLGFTIMLRDTSDRVGGCGFKAPPDANGVVEIAYGVSPEHEGRGYATEAAAALARYAFDTGLVRVVCAHSLPGNDASARVLAKVGFRRVGEIVDPEDGPVWRWEMNQDDERWGRLVRGIQCPMDAPRPDVNDHWDLVAKLTVSSLYLSKNQTYRGHCQLIFDPRHAARPGELTADEWTAWCADLFRAQGAIMHFVRADHINIETLGNVVPHLHWHIIPRYRDDPRWGSPIWLTSLTDMIDTRISDQERQTLIAAIRKRLEERRRT